MPLLDTGGITQPGKSLLAQLLLKAGSSDKKFVIEEAQRALETIASSMDAPAILGRLLPYAAHKNPKVCACCLKSALAAYERHVRLFSSMERLVVEGEPCSYISYILDTLSLLKVLFRRQLWH